MGLSKSPSPKPTARSMARLGVRSTPSVTSRLFRLRRVRVSVIAAWSFPDKEVVARVVSPISRETRGFDYSTKNLRSPDQRREHLSYRRSHYGFPPRARPRG